MIGIMAVIPVAGALWAQVAFMAIVRIFSEDFFFSLSQTKLEEFEAFLISKDILNTLQSFTLGLLLPLRIK